VKNRVSFVLRVGSFVGADSDESKAALHPLKQAVRQKTYSSYFLLADNRCGWFTKNIL